MDKIDKIIAAFPRRTIKVNCLKSDHSTFSLFLAILMLVLAVAVAMVTYPGLIADYKISQKPVEIAASTDGGCHVSYNILVNCQVTLTYQNKTVSKDFSYIDFSYADKDMHVFAYHDNPALMTTNIAIDTLGYRTALPVCIMLLFLLMAITMVRPYFKSNYQLGVIKRLSGQHLKLTVIDATIKYTNKYCTVYYNVLNNYGKKIILKTRLNLSQQGGPIFVDRPEGATYHILAIHNDNERTPVILDAHLTRCDFTAQEKLDMMACLNIEPSGNKTILNRDD